MKRPQAGPAQAPEVVSQELEITEQGLTDFRVRLDGQVKSAEPLTLEKADYEVVVEGKVVKNADVPLNVAVAAGETRPFSVEGGSQYVSSAEELKKISERSGSLASSESPRSPAIRRSVSPTTGSRQSRSQVSLVR